MLAVVSLSAQQAVQQGRKEQGQKQLQKNNNPRNQQRVDDDIHIFAAASLAGQLDGLVTQLLAQDAREIKFIYGSSSKLVRQIERGAPADIVILAHPDWAAHLHKTTLFVPPINWLTTRLVLAVPHNGPDGLNAFDQGMWFATGDPAHVPLGIYARQALVVNGLWAKVQPLLIAAQNAGHAARLLLSGAVEAAILYEAQLADLDTLKIAHRFNISDHDQIIYQLFIAKDEAHNLVNLQRHLLSDEAQLYFKARGFTIIADKTQPKEHL